MIKRGYWCIPKKNDLWISHRNLGSLYFVWNNKHIFSSSFQIFKSSSFTQPIFVVQTEINMIAFFVFEKGNVKKTGYLSNTEIELIKLGITLIISLIAGLLL